MRDPLLPPAGLPCGTILNPNAYCMPGYDAILANRMQQTWVMRDDSDFSILGFDYQPKCSLAESKFFLTDKNAIKADIDLSAAAGPTRNNIGLAWGWYTLSPQWVGASGFNNATLPSAYNGASKKIAVMLTQGNNLNPAVDDPAFSQICETMKEKGVEVFTITFDVTDVALKSRMQNCASMPGNYFNAPTTGDLDTSFRRIADNIKLLRISQ